MRICGGARDAENEASVRYKTVVDAEHRGAQVAAAAEAAMPKLDAAGHAGAPWPASDCAFAFAEIP